MKKLKIVYAGSPLASAFVLDELAKNADKCGFEICAVLTNPPSSRGRHKELIATDVAVCAKKNGLHVLTFEHLKGEAREEVAKLNADLLVSFDFGRIFGPKFLSIFPLGGINLHPGKLPEYRGCTPIPAAILNGDSEIEISLQKLSIKTDEGDLLATQKITLDGSETTKSLMDGDGEKSAVSKVGAELLLEVLSKTAEKNALPPSTPQIGKANYTPLLTKDDGKIDWNESAQKIERKIRAFTPWPNCFTSVEGVRLQILEARAMDLEFDAKIGTVIGLSKDKENEGIQIKCANGVLCVRALQLEKKKAMDWKSFLNGNRDFVGKILGN